MKNQRTFSHFSLIFSLIILALLVSTPTIAEESVYKVYAQDRDSELLGHIPSYVDLQLEIAADEASSFRVYKNDQAGITFETEIYHWDESQSWIVALGAANNALLAVGPYELAQSRQYPEIGADPSQYPSIKVSFNSQECSYVNGNFEVLELEYAGEEVVKFAADFTMYCDYEYVEPIFGSIRFQSDVAATKIDANKDFDHDEIPDQVDADDDNDGEHDRYDAFPLDANETVDADGDGIGNHADSLPANELCPNSIFRNGDMWSGDIQLVENTCSKTGQICENTYFQGRGHMGKSACVAGQWREYWPTHRAILAPVAVLNVNGQRTTGRAPHVVRVNGLGSYSDDGRTFIWDFGDGSPLNYEIIPLHVYQEPGTYTLTLTVTDDLGQSDTDSTTIVVTEPLVTFSCPNTIFADGKMWSGELQYIDNSCTDEGDWCPNTYFADLGGRFDAECIDGKWQQY